MTRVSHAMRIAALAGLVVMAPIADVLLTSGQAKADPRDQFSNTEEPNFGSLRLVPGKQWYRVNKDIPAAVIVQVEEQLTARARQSNPNAPAVRLCKIEVSPGVVISNLKICPLDHKRMSDPEYGFLLPMIRTGNFFNDSFVNASYDMRPTYADVALARLIDQTLRAYRPTQVAVEAAAPRRRASAPLPPTRVTSAPKVDYLTGRIEGRQIRLQLVAE